MMNHIRRFLSVMPMFLETTCPSNWTADHFYIWLQVSNPSILAELKLTPDAFFSGWVGTLANLIEPPEGISHTLIDETKEREERHKTDRISTMAAIQISQETPTRTSLSESDLTAPVVLLPRLTKASVSVLQQPSNPARVARPSEALQESSFPSTTSVSTFRPTAPGLVTRTTSLQSGSSHPSTALQSGLLTPSTKPMSAVQQQPSAPGPVSRSITLQSASTPFATSAHSYVGPSIHPRPPPIHSTSFSQRPSSASYKRSTSKSMSKRKRTHYKHYPNKRYIGTTTLVISDSDSGSTADDMDYDTQGQEMDGENEGWEYGCKFGWEDEDSDLSWDSKNDRSAPILMRLGFKPMIDINLKCNNYIRQLCTDIYSSGAQTIVLFDWDNQPVPEIVLSINPRDSGVYSVIVQGRSSKEPIAPWPRYYGYLLTTPRPFKEAADHEMFMLACSLLYAGILHDKIVVVVTADIGLENIMLYMNERSISSVTLTSDDLISYLNRIVPGCFNDQSKIDS